MSTIAVTPARVSSRRARVKVTTIVRALAALFVSLIFFAPIYWMIMTAFKTGNEAFTSAPSLFAWPNLTNFQLVFTQSNFGPALATSLFVATLSTVLCLMLGASIAYPLARLNMRGQKHLAFWIFRSGSSHRSPQSSPCSCCCGRSA